jgi:hypothetical protein
MRLNAKKTFRLVAAPVLVVGMGLPLLNCGDVLGAAEGCDELHAADFGASLDIDAKLKVFMEASARFETLGTEMINDAATSCINIATAAGGDPAKWQGKTGSDLAKAACDEAAAKVNDVFAAAANAQITIDVVVTGGHCEASLDATASCNAKCDVSGKCTPGQLEAKCEPGKLAGSCTGECSGSCDVQGGSVDCQGSCGGTCTGTCNGTCSAKDGNGNCVGKCTGSCTGSCGGTCDVVAPKATCMGTCHGSCTVDFQAPKCEGTFTPPECNLDADCQASCNASINAQADCTPPAVEFAVNGDMAAVQNLQAVIDVLTTELPKLVLNAVDRGEAAVANVTALVDASGSLEAAFTSGKAFACAAAAVEAAASASVNVSVSVEVSASVSGSAKVN